MSGFEIVIGRSAEALRSPAPPATRRPAWGVLDMLVDGANVTARVGEGHTLPFLRDLAYAVVDLATGRRARATVPFYVYEDAWELGLVRDGASALLSVFRAGAQPDVAVHERRIDADALLAGLSSAIDDALRDPNADLDALADLAHARDLLGTTPSFADGVDLPAAVSVTIDAPRDVPLGFGCDLLLRPAADAVEPTVARSDLLALLARTRLRVTVRGRTRELGDTFAFLVVERFAEVAREVLEAEARGDALYRRGEIAGLRFAVRLTSEGALGVTLRRLGESAESSGETYPELSAKVFAGAVVTFGRMIARAFVRHDRGQLQNLRLTALRSALKTLAGSLRPREELAARVNEAPESYRAYAQTARRTNVDGPRVATGKLRFSPRWVATVPAIDLGATFLCGDRLIVGGSREIGAIDRTSGDVLWSRPASRATAVPTPGGLARIHADGTVDVHDYGNGEITLSVKISPRIGAPATGAVVHAPGLPKLLVVTEGERHLSAIDLVSGEIRWRHTLTRGGTCRVRRAGRLLLLAAGDATLTAVDAASGEVVWRLCAPGAANGASNGAVFSLAPSFDHDTLFAVAGPSPAMRRARARVLAIDAWTGTVRFDAPLPAQVAAASAALVASDAIAVVTRDDRGLGLAAFDRGSGELRFHLSPGLAPFGTAWMAVDDAIVANTDQGELLSLDTATGALRFRLRLATNADDAVPRRLEPVLRSGALFVPQRELHVVRPKDGELLGQVPCDLIPDLLRVDERCDVYVAEESGHIAAFGAGPRLSLVKK